MMCMMAKLFFMIEHACFEEKNSLESPCAQMVINTGCIRAKLSVRGKFWHRLRVASNLLQAQQSRE